MNQFLVNSTIQEKVAEALRFRGYFISVKEEGIYLSSANHREDKWSFGIFFKELGVTCTKEGKIELLPELDIKKVVESIRFMPGRNHEAVVHTIGESGSILSKESMGRKSGRLPLIQGSLCC